MTYYSHPPELFHPRSPEWPAVERAHKRAEPRCRGCGTSAHVDVHHVLPFHEYPAHELDPANLVSACRGPFACHFGVGHRGTSWSDWDPDCVAKMDARRAELRKAGRELT